MGLRVRVVVALAAAAAALGVGLASAGAAVPPAGEGAGERLSRSAGVEETVAEIIARGRRRGGAPVDRAEAPVARRRAAPDPAAAAARPAGREPMRTAEPHTPATSFLAASGPTGGDSNFVPPDSMGSVGPTQVLVAVSGRIKVFSKTGAPGELNTTLDNFFGSLTAGGAADPLVEYDRLSGRWFVGAIEVGAPTCPNKILLAVSSGSRITDQTSFTFFSFTGRDGFFADWPTLGVDANALYIGANMFDDVSVGCSAPETLNASAFVIDKAELLDATPALEVTAFHDLVDNSSMTGEWTPQGVHNMDASATEGYFVGVSFHNFSQLVLRRVTDPAGTPTLSAPINLTVPPTALPTDVPQPSPNPLLDGGDDRLGAAMVARNRITGALSLWTAHQIEVNASGAASDTGGRNGSRWYEIGSLSGTPSVVQSGTLFDPATTDPLSFWIPSIAASGQGHASLNTSVSGAGAGAHPGVAASGRLRTDALGTVRAHTLAQSSTFNYDTFDPGDERWGDYSQTVVDPDDDMTFWTFQEYVNATNQWGVRVIELRPPPPATPSSAPSVSAGQPSVDVEITGTSTDGSEFFDPGAGFADRIDASVSGGVAVNSVTFTDPTHVTLDLDTTGATPGTKTVTITNPDGQSAAGAVLDVTSGSSRILTVSRAGPGSGTVTGPGIACGLDCTASVPTGTTVNLTAIPDAGSELSGWAVAGGGSCPGTGGCAVTLDADKTVTATFGLAPPIEPPVAPPAEPSNQFQLGELNRNTKKGTATLEVTVPGPGELELSGKGVKPQRPASPARGAPRVAVGAAGTVTLKVKATGKAKRRLREKGKVRLTATITYTPAGGDPATQTKRVKLLKRR